MFFSLFALFRQGIRPDLKFHYGTARAESSFHMPYGIRAVVRVEGSPLPSRFRIIDPAVHATGEKTHGVRYAKHQPCAVALQCEQRIRVRAVGQRKVFAKSD